MTRARSATTTDAVGGATPILEVLPSIRFSMYHDARAPRPSLVFSPVARTLPTGNEVIRVGRYSERDNQPSVPINVPSAAPVGFKSKVVSRRHCEFWYEGGKWYIKDVKSSSGTFLNHIRLSPPNTESRPFPIHDGDMVQLGIDFKGGEEMIFRCVKMRLELNRGWQNKLNTFNMATHKRLRNMTSSSGAGNAAGSYSQDCSICLNRIAPCQCLFVAPCSHTWHYKCIRALLLSPNYPIFQCPNCRAAADLDADIEDTDEWEHLDSEEEVQAPDGSSASLQINGEAPPRKSRESARSVRSVRSARVREAAATVAAGTTSGQPKQQQQQQQQQPLPPVPAGLATGADAVGDMTMLLDAPSQVVDVAGSSKATTPLSGPSHATSEPVPIPTSPGISQSGSAQNGKTSRTPSPTNGRGNGHEGPITPRNDAGPWVFDGSGMRVASLSAAVADEDTVLPDAA